MKMSERRIEELLSRVALPGAPEGLRERVMRKAHRARSRGSFLLWLTWYRALKAAAALAMLAGAAGRAY